MDEVLVTQKLLIDYGIAVTAICAQDCTSPMFKS